MPYLYAKVQGQRSVGSEDRVETNGRTDRRTEVSALPPSIMRSAKIVIIDVYRFFTFICFIFVIIAIVWRRPILRLLIVKVKIFVVYCRRILLIHYLVTVYGLVCQ